MISQVLRGFVLAGVLVGSVSTAVLADAPKTEADCQKAKDMMWDGKACVPKK